MSFIHTLEALVRILEHRDPTIRDALRLGRSHSAIEAALVLLPLALPPELFALYQWHDGVDTGRTTELLFGEHTLLSLDEAAYEYQAILHAYANPAAPLDLAHCFPFAAFQGSYLALSCQEQPFEGFVHPIIGIFEGVHIAFENVDAMAQTVIAWFSSGVYDTEPVDEQRKKAIWRHHNPHVPARTTIY